EAMLPARALANGVSPKRYITMFGGSSMPGLDRIVPTTYGSNYDLKRGILALGKNFSSDASVPAIQNEVSIVSNLVIPWRNAGSTGSIPPGGRVAEFHASSM